MFLAQKNVMYLLHNPSIVFDILTIIPDYVDIFMLYNLHLANNRKHCYRCKVIFKMYVHNFKTVMNYEYFKRSSINVKR